MPTLTENIASWDEDALSSGQQFAQQDYIATEATQTESPEWKDCIDALLRIMGDASSNDDDVPPTHDSIVAALSWIVYLRKRFPTAPPTCIMSEPAGGVIVERRVQLSGGRQFLSELTFYNDGSAERTDYCNGRIWQMTPILQKPDGLGLMR